MFGLERALKSPLKRFCAITLFGNVDSMSASCLNYSTISNENECEINYLMKVNKTGNLSLHWLPDTLSELEYLLRVPCYKKEKAGSAMFYDYLALRRILNILNTLIVIVLNQSQFLFACEALAKVYLKVAAPAFTVTHASELKE
uniref:Uncharacterized protein n=1 Tax=Glossina austeni TaxID=7395 RepID=A0A1A9VKS3_GLOAU